MIVGVESNFILELAFLRSEHEACTRLLELAEAQQVRVALPAFSIGETYEAWVRRSKQRRDLYNRLRTELGELSRSQPYEKTPTQFEEVTSLLIRSSEEEKRRPDATLDRILKIVAEIIPIGLDTIRSGFSYQQSHGLSPQDSIVYASILRHLTETGHNPSCFVTKNSKDFDNPNVENELKTYSCQLLKQFRDTLGYVHSRLARTE